MLSGVAFLACASPLGQAATVSLTPDCSATGGGWSCYLPGIFQFLWVIAIILGLILLAVIAVAVRSYFRIKHDEKVDS
jgi:uncharacterized membrane protein